MPCSPGMRGCRASCRHRSLVDDYRAARHAQILEEEAVTIADPEMIANRRAAGIHPVTFKEWLTGHAATAGQDMPAA